MIINRIYLENFRQFRGQQEIEFAKGEKNVTVVFGENGRGKTGLFRALMFCLYGDTSLAQDGDVTSNILVNEPAMRESPGTCVEAKVQVDFEHEHTRYRLSRKIVGLQTDSGKISQERGQARLQVTDREGKTSAIECDDDISSKVGKVLNKQVRDYFLFDGERIERLTRQGKTQVEDVKKGIRAILSLDDVGIALQGLVRLRKKLDAEVAESSSGDLQKLEFKKISIEKTQDDIEEKLKRNEQEQLRLEEQQAGFAGQLSKIREVKELQSERVERKNHLDQARLNLSKIQGEMKALLNVGGLLVAGPQLGALSEELKGKVKAGELPQNIKGEFVQRLIKQGECICGRSFGPDSEAAQSLKVFKQQLPEANDTQLLELWNTLTSICGRRTMYFRDVERVFHNYYQISEEILRTERQIEDLGGEIKEQGGDTVLELEEARVDLEKARIKLVAEEQSLREKQQTSEDDLAKVARDIAAEEKHSAQARLVRRKRGLVAEAEQCLEELRERFTKRVREQLEERSTHFFQRLADSGTKMSLDRVTIGEDYSLGVGSKYASEVLADISAGQRQIVSLSFISALIGVASGEGKFEVPLFMDTPFGRLSGEHRDALLRNIPEVANQWILLSTDTEFSKDEARCLQATGKWGKLYLLQPVDAGVTKIEEQSIGAFQPTRGVS